MLALVKDDTTSLLQLPDGSTLRYRKSGVGPPLVLLHTIRMQLEYFDRLAPLLADKFTVYAVDLPGHGLSSIDPKAPYDEPYLRRGIVGFIESRDLRDVTLAGESIGAVLAFTVAAELPDRMKKVVALNPYDYETRYADGLRRGNLIANLIIGSFAIPVIGAINAATENVLLLRWVLSGGFHDPRNLPRDLLYKIDRDGRRPGFRTVERRVFAGWRSWPRARDLYRNVKAPVTLIYGDGDWSRTEERERTARELPAAKMLVLRDTGHFSTLERPAEIAALIGE